MHRTTKLFLAAVFMGCASGLARADDKHVQYGPPSPIGKAVPYVPPPAPVSKVLVPYGPPCLPSPVTTTPVVTKTTSPSLTQTVAFGFDPFTLSSIPGNKGDKGDNDGKGASKVDVDKIADKSKKPDRSPGDKDHDHDDKGDKDDKGDHDGKGDGGRGHDK